MASEVKKKCSRRVFSGERGDIGGHPCGKPFKVTREGEDYCAFHDPQVEKKRRDKLQAKWDAESAARTARWKREEAAQKALDKLLPDANVTIATLERQLSDLREKLDWTPISPDNLPRVGDEVMRPLKDYCEVREVAEEAALANWDWRYAGFTMRRPINAPLAAPRGSK